MRVLALSFVFLSIIGIPAGAADRLVDGFPDLPKDAQKVAERSLACQHFWGEVNGTGDERDKEVARHLKQLKCDRIEPDLKQIRTKYRENAKILKILEEAALE